MKYVLLLAVILFFFPSAANAEPQYRVDLGGIIITLHSEKCEMKEVSNLNKLATWEEKGKKFTGCWGVNPFGIVSMYFTDKSVVGLPGNYFEKVTGV